MNFSFCAFVLGNHYKAKLNGNYFGGKELLLLVIIQNCESGTVTCKTPYSIGTLILIMNFSVSWCRLRIKK